MTCWQVRARHDGHLGSASGAHAAADRPGRQPGDLRATLPLRRHGPRPWRPAGRHRTRRRGFLLIEHPGPWAVDALAESGWSADGRRRCSRGSRRRPRARLLLIRRPGRRPVTSTRAWAAWTRGRSVRSVWGTWSEDGDLLVARWLSHPGARRPG